MDTKILATLRMVVSPERRGDFLEIILGMLQPTRVERGCLSYRLYEDIEHSNTFVLLHEWKTQEDIERHILKDNSRRLLALIDLLSEEPELQFNNVSQTIGMGLIENVFKSNEPG